MKLTCQFSLPQLQRQHTRALIVHSRPLGMAQSDTEMNILFSMLSNSQFAPPSAPTQLTHRRDFVADCKKCMRLELLESGCWKESEGKLRPAFGLPLASLSFDASPTGIKGVKGFSVSIHYTTKNYERKVMALKVGAFRGASFWLRTPALCTLPFPRLRYSDPKREIDGYLAGTAENIGAFVHATAAEFDLVLDKRDEYEQLILNISDSFFSAATDNASAEVSASVDTLGLLSARCQAHSWALSWKNGLSKSGKPREKRSIFDSPDGFDSDGAESDDDGPAPAAAAVAGAAAAAPPNRLPFLYADLRDCSGRAKISKLGSFLLGWQQRDGVVRPLSLVDGNETRWTNASLVLERACLLENYLCERDGHAGVLKFFDKEWSNVDWRTLKQCAAVLHDAKTLVLLMQGEQCLIGDHFVPMLRIIESLRSPATHLKLTPRDFVPSPDDLNSNPPLAYFSSARRKYLGTDAFLTADTKDFLKKVSENLTLRFAATGRSGGQHSCMPVMLGIAMHPAVKSVIFSKTAVPGGHLFSPQQKADTISVLRRIMNRVRLPNAPPVEDPDAGLPDAAMQAHDDWQFSMPGLSSVAAAPAYSFRDEISAWADTPPQSMSAAKYWALEAASETTRFPLLCIVARAVYGAPLTTAGDERNFSHAMKLLAKDRKGAMKAGTFEDLMLLRLNHKLWSSNRELMSNPDFKKYWNDK